jgi:hypothetical protein
MLVGSSAWLGSLFEMISCVEKANIQRLVLFLYETPSGRQEEEASKNAEKPFCAGRARLNNSGIWRRTDWIEEDSNNPQEAANSE